MAEVDGGLAIGPTTIGFSIPYPFLPFSLSSTLETRENLPFFENTCKQMQIPVSYWQH